MKSILSALVLVFVTLLSLSQLAFATDYHIGVGQTYPTLNSFTSHWLTLEPGDHVYIHPGTYKEHIFLKQSGTVENPIIIEGIPDENGNLPIIDGDDMVIDPNLDSHLTHYDPAGDGTLAQAYGLIFIYRSQLDDYTYEPEYITVKNLEIRSTTPESYTFTNSTGAVQAYPGGNAGVYVKTGNHLVFENLIIHDTGNGFEVQGVEHMVHDVVVRGCHIYDAGRTDASKYLEHGAYTEVSGMVYEYNKIGPMREGTRNSSIKSRGADTVIRYNVIYSASRALDLIEPENQAGYRCDGTFVGDGMQQEPGYLDTWVYGNVFINQVVGDYPRSGYPIHYGHDNCPAIPRNGTLHFYNNTVIHDMPKSVNYYSSIFDIGPMGTLDARNNVILSLQDTYLSLGYHSKSTETGTYNWNGGNWVTTGYSDIRDGYTGTWNENVTILNGSNAGVLADTSSGDYSIPVGSPLIDAGTILPLSITADHPIISEYVEPRTYQNRTDTDDIGAFSEDGSGNLGSDENKLVAPTLHPL